MILQIDWQKTKVVMNLMHKVIVQIKKVNQNLKKEKEGKKRSLKKLNVSFLLKKM